MPKHDLQKFRQDAQSVTYKDPLDPKYTFRDKSTSAPKTIDGIRATNLVKEFIVNDSPRVASDLTSELFADPISVRLKLSGSPNSVAHVARIVADLNDQVQTWLTAENAMLGFELVTVPSRTNTGG